MLDKAMLLKCIFKKINDYKFDAFTIPMHVILRRIEDGDFDVKESTGCKKNLEDRVIELEDQVCNIIEKNLKKITDTERLDFIERELCNISNYSLTQNNHLKKSTKWICSKNKESNISQLTLRDAIDTAFKVSCEHLK